MAKMEFLQNICIRKSIIISIKFFMPTALVQVTLTFAERIIIYHLNAVNECRPRLVCMILLRKLRWNGVCLGNDGRRANCMHGMFFSESS